MSWTKIHGEELQRLQTRLEWPPQSTILEASTLRTPFYHNGELVRMNDGMGTMFMVAAGPGELSARESADRKKRRNSRGKQSSQARHNAGQCRRLSPVF